MTRLVFAQTRWHYFPAWTRWVASLLFFPDESQVPAGTCKIAIFDNSDTPGAAGWHSEQGGLPYGRVFAKPAMDVGGDALMRDPTVASILSHEVLELLCDPTVNLWGSDFGLHGPPRAYAFEICDAVEANSYGITVGSAGNVVSGRVSNFLFPAWFDPTGVTGPYDYLGLLSQPFAMTPQGYLIYKDEAGGTGTHTVYGDRYDEWRKATKVGASRSARRRLRS